MLSFIFFFLKQAFCASLFFSPGFFATHRDKFREHPVFGSRISGIVPPSLIPHSAYQVSLHNNGAFLLFNGDSPHSARIFKCLETACRLISKCSAMAFGVMATEAMRAIMALRVGSAMAWKTSLLIV